MLSSQTMAKKWTFVILDDIGEYVTLVQLMYNFGNISRDVIISGIYIYNANNNKLLILLKITVVYVVA